MAKRKPSREQKSKPSSKRPVPKPTIKDTGMSEAEIRAAGLQIDVPFESGHADPKPLRYSDEAGEAWEAGDYLENMPTVSATPASELD